MSYRVLFAAFTLLTAACAAGSQQQQGKYVPVPTPLGGRVINVTTEMIERLNARSAWDIVERSAPRILLSQYARLTLNYDNERPLIVLDGARVTDVRVLREIAAGSIKSIRILTGTDGFMMYGNQASGGVIEVNSRI